MKLRLLALSAVLLTLSYAAPRSWAQDKDGAATPASEQGCQEHRADTGKGRRPGQGQT